uniref:Ig-like domain-containing protein n=1 Tax=Kryptolebias marmoratus TaxID=37003 RepID=A0A3Q3B0K6_KRYMA
MGIRTHLLWICYVFWTSEAWDVYLPSSIKALERSCVYIPCSFDYYRNPPTRPSRVVWYHWYPNDVIDQYRGRTRVTTGNKRCSLYISRVTSFNHGEKLYPWVDPENVGRITHRFFDKTVRIEVVEDPEITITVQCSADHTCYRNSPTLSLNIPPKDQHQTENSLGGGVYRVTKTTDFTIMKQDETIECTVQHHGGKRARRTETSIPLRVKAKHLMNHCSWQVYHLIGFICVYISKRKL